MGYQENMNYLYAMFPYAKAASGATGLQTSVILAQWAHETGFGTSDVANAANNHAGIKFVNGVSVAATNYGAYAKYNDLDQFTQDYERVINLSYYNSVRGQGTPEAAIAALGQSPYAEDPNYGNQVLGIFTQYGVRGFDTYQGGGAIALAKPMGVDNLTPDEITKYAGIGLALVALLALAK